jgi:hypothetical protein
MASNKFNYKIIILILLVITSIAITIVSVTSSKHRLVACTQEAKLCPDGSMVGRSGPNCEFTICPTPITVPDGWKTRTGDDGVTYQYPENFGTTYITIQGDWPPLAAVVDGPLDCDNTGVIGIGTSIPEQTSSIMISNRPYCVTKVSEGAAGSTYTQYAYATASDNDVAIFRFTLRFPQCDNYSGLQETACKNERATFTPDLIIDQIAQTLTIKRIANLSLK